MTQIVTFLPRLAVEILSFLLARSTFRESQRAEYLADALGARVSGSEAAVRLLEKLEMADLLRRALSAMRPTAGMDGREFLVQIGAILRQVPAATREAALAASTCELAAVDTTHPPTRHRKTFLRSLRSASPGTCAPSAQLARAQVEIDGIRAKTGAELVASAQVQ